MDRLYHDRYEPVALAGRGAEGEVWRARDVVHDRLVALKIRPVAGSTRDHLLAEARALLDLRPHPALPLVRDDFFDDDRYVIVMDWIDGMDLSTAIPMPFADVLDRLAVVADALDHLHAHDPPVVHGDVKPSNIVVARGRDTVLVDFGLATAHRVPYAAGTTAFVAPEIAAGHPATPAADVFSLAVTALVLLTGAPPEPGSPPDLSAVPEASRARVAEALSHALSFDPEERPRRAGEFIAAMRPPVAPNNLPADLSSFVGRAAATSELRHLLASTRLVTLVGSGGTGKTRLALRVADAAFAMFPAGIWSVELAGTLDAALVAARITSALGVRTTPGEEALDALVRSFGADDHLLVLDNCEHVVAACAELAESLLRSCPNLRILATSREALRATGERVWIVTPLMQSDAVELFVTRAPRTITSGERSQVDDICRRLDGIPLAIELAAAQLRTMTLDQLVGSLDDALTVLTGGPRTNERHESMTATITWSAGRLAPDEQLAFRRLSVFSGGWSRDATPAIGVPERTIDRLVETSLVARVGTRYRMLEPVRQFALDRLVDAGEGAEYRERHARWVDGLMTKPDSESTDDWIDRVADDHENLESALTFAIEHMLALAGRLVHAATEYWRRRGYWDEFRIWVDRALEIDGLDPATRAYLLYRAGDMALDQGRPDEGRRAVESSVALYRELADGRGLGVALLSLAKAEHAAGNIDAERSHLLESLELSREHAHRAAEAAALNNLAIADFSLGKVADAAHLMSESLDIHRELGELTPIAFLSINLAALYDNLGETDRARRSAEEGLAAMTRLQNDQGKRAALIQLAELDLHDDRLDGARTHAERALEICRRLHDRTAEMYPLRVLAGVARKRGDLDGAAAVLDEALVLCRDVGAALETATTLIDIGILEMDRGDAGAAVRNFAEARAIKDTAGLPPDDDPAVTSSIAAAKQQLGPRTFEREWEAGRRSVTERPS